MKLYSRYSQFPVFETARYEVGTSKRDEEEKRLYAARIEHVAKALWQATNEMDGHGLPWESTSKDVRDAWRSDARSILGSYVRSA